VQELKVAEIRRPLARTRTNDSAKVEALMESIQRHGLKQPIDVLEVTGPLLDTSTLAACKTTAGRDSSKSWHCRWTARSMASAVRQHTTLYEALAPFVRRGNIV
jgi:uncharacterized ParB-like nuclease family protein